MSWDPKAAVPAGPPATIADDPLARLLAYLLAYAPALARAVADHALGDVADLAPAQRRLLVGTLRAWFQTGSTAGAARLLYCHRNTVRNRLRRVERLTGHCLDDPRRVAELYLATELLDGTHIVRREGNGQ